jgi:hypothetical protein
MSGPSTSEFLSAAKNAVVALGNITARLTAMSGSFVATQTSGHLAANALVLAGYVRVKGVSVIAGSAVGYLNDSATAAGIATGTRVYQISATPGYYPMDIIVTDGLVFEAGTGMQVVISYSVV